VSYFWAAYPNVVSIMLGNLKERACNSSKLNKDEKSLEHRLPDLVVVSAGMWAILEEHHRRNVTEQGGQHGLQGYQRDLINLATDLKQVRLAARLPAHRVSERHPPSLLASPTDLCAERGRTCRLTRRAVRRVGLYRIGKWPIMRHLRTIRH
jgi:hypothetical protein